MGKANTPSPSSTPKPRRPALTPEARENQIIDDAMALAESQIRSGTASSQVITFFLKLGHEREKNKLELEKLREENKLLRAKTESIEANKANGELYEKAIKAMMRYQGRGDEDDYQNLF